MSRAPYDPATQGPQVLPVERIRRESERPSLIHDRRATDISRGHRNRVVETEIEDPYESGARISAIRSVRDDPLADHLARGHIDQAQYLAGREFQRHFGIAERGPRAMALAEAVDGSPARETLTDEQLKAGKWLSKCHAALGRDGSILIHDMLIKGMSSRQIAHARGVANADWQRYIARRFYECLDTLALVFGFTNGHSP